MHKTTKKTFGNKNKSGFTLIELLVVITIIALLLAILLPSLTKVRELGRRVICKTNLRQIAIAWHAYLNDYEGKFYQFPGAELIYGGYEGTDYVDVPRPLNPYLDLPEISESEDEAKVFKCPADKGGLMGETLPIYSVKGTSYLANIYLIGQDQIAPIAPGLDVLQDEINARLRNLRISQVDGHSRLLLVGDYGWLNQSRPLLPLIGDWHGREFFHNMAFLDNHVEFLRIRKGLFVTEEYTVLPFKGLHSLAKQLQVEEN